MKFVLTFVFYKLLNWWRWKHKNIQPSVVWLLYALNIFANKSKVNYLQFWTLHPHTHKNPFISPDTGVQKYNMILHLIHVMCYMIYNINKYVINVYLKNILTMESNKVWSEPSRT